MQADYLPRHLDQYIAAAWSQVEGGNPYQYNWHIGAISEHLMALQSLQLNKLIINIPPRHMKSLSVSVFFPTWVWTFDPNSWWFFTSYNGTFVERDSWKCSRLMKTPWYQARWGDKFSLLVTQSKKIINSAGGQRLAAGLEGGITGEGGDYRVIDDPHKAGKESESEVERQNVKTFWNHTWSTRQRDPRTTRDLIIMQRVHEDDLTGHLKDRGFEMLVLPGEFESERKCYTKLPFEDPRTREGELLWPKRFGPPQIEEKKVDLGPYGYAGQYQQRPAPLEGGLFKRNWFRRFKTLENGMLQTTDNPRKRRPSDLITFDPLHAVRFCTVDLAMTEGEVGGPKKGAKEDPDYTVFAAWVVFVNAKNRPVVFLTDLMRFQQEGPEILDKLVAFHEKHDFAVIGVEAVQAQSYILHFAKREGLPVRPIAKSKKEDVIYYIDSDKAARALSATPLLADGRFWVPEYAPWLEIYLSEMCTFPNSTKIDQVDVTAYAVAISEHATGKGLFAKMKALASQAKDSTLSRDAEDTRHGRGIFPAAASRDHFPGTGRRGRSTFPS